MHHQDAQEAARRFMDAAYNQRLARARFRVELNPNRLTFRAWARRTYGPHACTGKLARVVSRKDS
jgi:hypothetical protein